METKSRTYSIKATARMVDMNSHTIRAWERRYKALDPNRNEANNRREYTPDDVERLTLLSHLVKAGHQISHIAGLSTEILKSMAEKESPTPSNPESVESAEHIILNRCLVALENYEIVLIQAELESARHFLSAPQFLTGIAVPLIAAVGMRVAQNTFSIAQEHALSSVLRSQLMQVLFNLRNTIAVRAFTRKDQPQGKSVCLATRDGDLHEFGILSAAILIAHHGHVPHYFGPNLPAEALADAAKAVKSDVVLVGNTPNADALIATNQRNYLKALKSQLPSQCDLWWGGYCAISDPQDLTGVTRIGTLEALKSELGRLR